MTDRRDRKLVNGASLEEAITKVMTKKTEVFEDIVFGIIEDSGLNSTVLVKALAKKLIDSGFTDTEQMIFVSAIVASCIDSEEIKSWFSEKNIEFLSDIDSYGFILDGVEQIPDTDETNEEEE